jgi:hypothetical protein
VKRCHVKFLLQNKHIQVSRGLERCKLSICLSPAAAVDGDWKKSARPTVSTSGAMGKAKRKSEANEAPPKKKTKLEAGEGTTHKEAEEAISKNKRLEPRKRKKQIYKNLVAQMVGCAPQIYFKSSAQLILLLHLGVLPKRRQS